MAAKKSIARKSRKKNTWASPDVHPDNHWATLEWDDLQQWAGTKTLSRGRDYQSHGRVKDLAITKDGKLFATVQGTQAYITSVEWNPSTDGKHELSSRCTCPVGFRCKHAVAVIIEYLDALAEERTVPTTEGYDIRARNVGTVPGDAASEAEWTERIHDHIRAKSHEELIELACRLVDRYPELHQEFQERISLSQGNVNRLVAETRREITAVTSQDVWVDDWSGEGFIPDYSPIQHRLERLLELGHADVVVELGREFIVEGLRQMGEAHDEGETGMALGESIAVVFQAVERSSLSPAEKLLFVIQVSLEDDWGILHPHTEQILEAEWPAAVWSEVADRLTEMLDEMPLPQGGRFYDSYQRDSVSNWLVTALDNAGRDEECLALYEREARVTDSYERLVKYLISRKKYDEAERWALEGIEKTREKLPGIATSLAQKLRDVAEARRQWDVVAGYAAWQFFDHPSTRGFRQLLDQAKKAKCVQKVRKAALNFLETGVAPIRFDPEGTTKAKKKSSLHIDNDWPLPVPPFVESLMGAERRSGFGRSGEPHYDVLLDMAIEDNRPDDVVQWYDRLTEHRKPRSNTYWGWTGMDLADRVAEAISTTHPERALEIYQKHLNHYLPEAKISSYEQVAFYLRKMKPVMERLGRGDDWPALVAGIREKYRNRPRLLEILDKVDSGTIFQTLARKKS